MHGDQLDMDAFLSGTLPADFLKANGYSGRTKLVSIPCLPDSVEEALAGKDAEPSGTIQSNSYNACVLIVEGNVKDVLQGRKVEFNEMTGRTEIGRVQISDPEIDIIRSRIERLISGGRDSKGRSVGMKQTRQDVQRAVDHIAFLNKYHPVRDYLNSLKWDGIERLNSIPEDILSINASPLNIAIMRRFMISAVARALQPGCQVDTMLILVGKQGTFKSSLFRVLAGPKAFTSSAIDINSKDGPANLRRFWISEWAELANMKGKDQDALKAFLTNPEDNYRPAYGHYEVSIQRSGVIVGTTNEKICLRDETGNRRFWPIEIDGHIDLKYALEHRDQLWAEAVTAYQLAEQWHLTPDEVALLEERHAEHTPEDTWSDLIISWAENSTVSVTTADLIMKALEKPKGMWAKSDEHRVYKIMTTHGWRLESPSTKRRGKSRRWLAPT
jgi:predicted P-loop ATPase